MKVEWLNCLFDEDYNVYAVDLAELTKFETIELDKGKSWLVLNWDKERLWLKFAVIEWCMGLPDENKEMGQCLWSGEGPSGNLRELRHSEFGEGGDNPGYIFYVPLETIKRASLELQKYFD